MGDRYEWFENCPICGVKLNCYYAESSGFTSVTCDKCKTIFNIIMEFKLVKKGDINDENRN